MSYNREPEIKEKIVKILKGHPEGLTIEELRKMIVAHRQTVTKYVLELKDGGIVHRRRVGSATLHYMKDMIRI